MRTALHWMLLLCLCAGMAPALGGNLARDASYTVTVSGFAYRGQIIPGTNTPAVTEGFADAPPWQGPADTLTDGKRDGSAVTSWFWSQMRKRITARFDLRRPARVTAVRAWPKAGSTPFDATTLRVAATTEALPKAPEVKLAPEGEGFAWRGDPIEGRFVEVVCAGGAPQMTLAEVEIEGEPVGPVAAGAPPPGLRRVPPRDLAPLVRLPDKPAGVANVAAAPGVKVTASLRHYDDKIGAWTDDPAPSAEAVRALTDGAPRTAVRSHSGWYGARTVTVELDLGKPWQVERVVVWSAGHGGQARSYLNAFRVWLRTAPEGAWTPAGETRNPLLPGEAPGREYPVASGVINRPARLVRVQVEGAAQSGDVVEVGEVEIWTRPAVGEVSTARLRVKKPVPAIAPVRLGQLSPACAWIEKERIRAMYGYIGQWKDAGFLDRVIRAGFNTILVHTMGATHRQEGWPAEAEAWARVQRERGLRVIVSWPFGSDERYGNTRFGAYQPGGTILWERGPCPLSREYWERVVGDRAVIAARARLAGLVVDMEMYAADSTRYPGPCYCDTCFSRFVEEHLEGVAAGEVVLADRPAWTAGNGLARDYPRRQEIEVAAILQGIRERVHAVNPDFLLGNLLDPESLPGLARGFGTPEMPALIFSELEYPGNTAGTPGRISQLREGGYPALYVVGFALTTVTPSQLTALAGDVAPGTAGYWLWSSASLRDGAPAEYAHPKAYSHDDYWKGFRAANDAVAAALRTGGASAPAGTQAVPQTDVPRTAGAPKSDAEWAAGVPLEPFLDHMTGAPAKAATRARALWDGKRLHLSVTCEEPAPEKSPPLQGGRDDGSLWQQESVEVFWMRPGSGRYAHVVVNAAGTVLDALAEGLRAEDPGWNADVRTQARKTAGGWELLLSIPLDADGAGDLPPGSRIRFELARNRPGGGETTCWAPTRGMFRGAPELWGVLTLR